MNDDSCTEVDEYIDKLTKDERRNSKSVLS